MEAKHDKISEKTNISYPQRVRNVCFSEILACFAFLKHPFWDSPICLIPDELCFMEDQVMCNLFLFCIIDFKMQWFCFPLNVKFQLEKFKETGHTGPSLDLVSVRFLSTVGFNFDKKFVHFL